MNEQYTDLETIVKNIPEYEPTKPNLDLKFNPTFETEIEMPDVVRVRNITPDMIKENWQVKEKGFFQNFGRGIWTDQGRQINDLIDSNWTLPNATDESAQEMTDIIMRGKLLRDQHREFVDANAGYSADSGWAKAGRGLGNAVGSSIQYAVIGGLTGSVGIFGVGAIQAALQSDENWKKTYLQEHGTLDGYAPENQIYSVANGAVQGWIEQKLGVENLVSGALRDGSAGVAKWTAKKAVQGALGESAEEFTQEITEYGFGKLAGQERRDSEQLAKDALAGAVYGGIVGGAMGSSMYYANRRNLSKALQKTGMDEALANKTAQNAIDAGTEQARKEIITRAQLEDRFGDSYTGLIDKIDSALTFTGWQNNNLDKNQKEYATENADTIARQVIAWADMNGMTTDEALNLSKIDVIDNVVYLDQSAIGDVNSRIKEKKAQLKEQNALAKTGAGDANLRDTLRKQIPILEKLKVKRDYELQNIEVSEKSQQAKKDIKVLKKSKASADEFFANLSESDRLSLLNPDGSLNQNALQDRYENAMMVDLLDNDVMAYDTLSTQINGPKIVRALIQAMPSIDALSKTYPNRNIKKEIAKAILLSKGLTKANFTQRINNQPITGADAFITNSLLYNFTFSDAQGISAFINNYAQMAQQNSENANTKDSFGNQVSPERLNSEIMADLLVKTYDMPNVKNPVFDENGVALQKEMRAVLLTQSAQPLAPSLFNQTDIKADVNSPEFKKWFGDSKVVDEKGKPLTVYHQTGAEFDTFDPTRAENSKGDFQTPVGIFAKSTSSDIGMKGKIQMPMYISMNNPLSVSTRGELENYVRTANPEYAKLANETISVDRKYKADFNAAEKADDIDEMQRIVNEWKVVRNTKGTEARESLTATLKEKGFDGVIIKNDEGSFGRQTDAYIAFEPNQVKSINNQGTFNSETGNIYYQSEVQPVDFEKAKEYFGTTEDLTLAGYVLPDGTLLDFSGKKLGSDGKSRTIDHREVGDAYDNDIDMDDFLSAGGIRIDSNFGIINTNTMPTEEQWSVLKTIINNKSEQIRLEVNKSYSELNDTSFVKVQSAIRGALNNTQSKLAQFRQGKQTNGYFDPELQVIVLGKNTNSGTLPHEMSHFWLEKMFNMVMKEQNITPELANSMSQLFKVLGVSEDQTKLTIEQHEQFANMSEAYIFQLAELPAGTQYAFNRFMAFVPAKYENIMSVGYRDENGIIKHPLLDKTAIDWFNAWYGNGALPIISESPAGMKSLNSVDKDNKIIPSKEQTIQDRESELDNGFKETKARYADQQQQIDQGTPQSVKAEIGVAESKILANPDLIEQDLARLEQPTEKRRFNWLRVNPNAEQVQKADEYKRKNKEHAYEIAFGDPQLVPNDTGINRAFLIKSVMNDFQVGSNADSILRYNYAQNASLSGSGLQAYRGESMALYLESAKKLFADIDKENAYKMFGKNKNALAAYEDAIQALILQHADAIIATKPNSDARNKAIDTLTKQAELQFGGQGDARLLKQMDLTGQKTTSRDVFITWANKELKRIIQTKEQRDRVNKLYSETEKARKASIEIDSNDPATYTAAAKMLKDFNKFLHATDENSWVQKLFGNYAINAMLSNPSTHIVNISSNTINFPVVLAAMKAQFKAQGVSNTVPRDKIKAQTDKLNTIYNGSYLNLATMDNLASESLMVGERYKLPDAENKSILNLPGRALSKADTWFRFPMFSEAAAMIASREAKATGRNSSEIFDEICSMNNKKGKTSKTNRAAELRQEALMIANMATFTQDGTLEKSINWMRSGLNKMTGDPNFGLGNLLAPFVKTPANIVEMGARALPASFYKAVGAIVDVKGRKAGKYDWNIKDTLGWSYLALGVMASIALASDYEPPYEPPQTYNPDKPYDSIKIGGVWIKLDAFGPFGIPMRMAASSMYGKGFSTGILNDTPLIGDIEYQSNLWQRAPGMAASKYAYGQANKLMPAILKPGIQYGFRSADAELIGQDLDVGFKTGIARSIERQYGLDGRNMDFVDMIHELTIKKVKFDE